MEEQMSDEPQFPEAELARLADGTLPGKRAAQLRGQLADSTELQHALAEQERALALVRTASGTAAPASLRGWLDERARATAPTRQRPRLAFALPAIAAAVVVVVTVAVLASGGSSAPTLDQTTQLALASASGPKPSVSPGNPAVLTDTAAGIPVPNWGPAGFRPTGARVDTVAGRTIMTVFYADPHGNRVGYAIVGGAPIAVKGGMAQEIGGVQYNFLTVGRAHLVTWVQSGHTCVVAGRTVSPGVLLRLVTA